MKSCTNPLLAVEWYSECNRWGDFLGKRLRRAAADQQDWDNTILPRLRFMIGDGRPKAVPVDSSGSEGRSSTRRQRSQRSDRYRVLNPSHVIDDMHEVIHRPEIIDVRCQTAADRIVSRIGRAGFGHMGDVKTIGGIGELRIDYGPRYRVYFVRKGQAIIILLRGGDKCSQ